MKTLKALLWALLGLVFIQCNSDHNKDDLEPSTKLTLSSNEVLLSDAKTYESIDIIDPSGQCYAETSDYDIVRAYIEDEKLIILGVKTGEATISVMDSYDKKAEVKVTIDNLTRPETGYDVVYIKNGSSRTFSHPYPTNSGFSLIPDESNNIVTTNLLQSDSLVVEGKEIGRTVLSVEKEYWCLYHYDIRVVDVYPLEISVKEYSVFPTRPAEFGGSIAIGNGDYKVESSDTSIATAAIEPFSKKWEKTNHNFNEARLRINTFGKPGIAILTVTDAAALTETVTVEVREK